MTSRPTAAGGPGTVGAAGTVDDAFGRAARQIAAAVTAADLFGADGRAAVQEYRRLARLVHPDRVEPARQVAATEAFTRLARLWRRYARPSPEADPVVVTTRRGSYRIGAVTYQGDLATLYRFEACDGPPPPDTVLLKVPDDPADNDLLDREANALRRIAAEGDPRYLPYVPRLVDSFRLREPGTGIERRANAVAAAAGLCSLSEVAAAYPGGLDPRDLAWMWRRLLVALGLAHRAGVVHGAVLPDHVLIQPAGHGVVLVDWCYAAIGGDDRVPALVSRYADWYPAEVAARQPAGPGTDIAMATRCMTALAGDRLPGPLSRFAVGCLLRPLARRPDDAWRLLCELDEVLERCFGPRRFRPFSMPRPAPS